ncbi:MAG TPA: hypothetical protein VH143_07135 [Kofleriaceae bacterium]|jgi:hypothetical protein|nr:hypothetical protein [Kofleriaceae bacterium]
MKLEDSHIAEPCTKAWDELLGDGRTRACDACTKAVHDLSSLTRAEADELLAAKPDACVRYVQRGDGTLVLADGLVRGRGARTRSLVLAAAIVGGTAYVTLPVAHHSYYVPEPTVADYEYSLGGAVSTTATPADPPATDGVGSAASAGAATPDNAPPKSSADLK